MMKQRWGLDRNNVLRPTPGDPTGTLEQTKTNSWTLASLLWYCLHVVVSVSSSISVFHELRTNTSMFRKPSKILTCHLSFEPRHDKTNKMSVRPAKTQISLGIRPVWSESSLSAWRKLGSLATHWAHSEDWSDWADAQADLTLRWEHFLFCWL